MKFSFILFALFFAFVCRAQDTTYHDSNWAPADKNSASYYRIISRLDTCWRIEDYFIDGKLQMQGYLSSPNHTDRHGEFKWYDEEGRLQETGSYSHGKKHGVLYWYYPDGKIKTIETYSGGKNEGLSESYYPNGKLSLRGFSANGALHGNIEYWYDNGHRKATGQFYNGKQDGIWAFYDTAGIKTDEVLFAAKIEFEECKIAFEIPSNDWYYNGQQSNSRYIWHEFLRKPYTNPDGIDIVPNISFISEEVPDDLDVVNFSLVKRSSAGFEVDSMFNDEDTQECNWVYRKNYIRKWRGAYGLCNSCNT